MKREDYIISFSYHHCPILVIWTFGCFQTCVGTLFSSEAYAYMMSCHLLGGAIVSLSIEADGAESVDWLFKRVKIHTEPALSWNSFLDPIFSLSHRETVSVPTAIIVIFCDNSPSSRFTPRLPSSLSRSAKVAEKSQLAETISIHRSIDIIGLTL